MNPTYAMPSDLNVGDRVEIVDGFDVGDIHETIGTVDEISGARISVRMDQSGRSAWIHHELLTPAGLPICDTTQNATILGYAELADRARSFLAIWAANHGVAIGGVKTAPVLLTNLAERAAMGPAVEAWIPISA